MDLYFNSKADHMFAMTQEKKKERERDPLEEKMWSATKIFQTKKVETKSVLSHI